MKRSKKRDQLVETAARLFAHRGFHQTGVDTILEEAGVAKRTFYNHFPSKDDLIVAVLAQEGEDWCEWFRTSVNRLADHPEDRLLAMFDVLELWMAGDQDAGASFLKAIVEYPEPTHPVRQAVREHDESLRSILRDWANAASIQRPVEVADQLILLVSGAMVEGLLKQGPQPARLAKEIARRFLADLSEGAC